MAVVPALVPLQARRASALRAHALLPLPDVGLRKVENPPTAIGPSLPNDPTGHWLCTGHFICDCVVLTLSRR